MLTEIEHLPDGVADSPSGGYDVEQGRVVRRRLPQDLDHQQARMKHQTNSWKRNIETGLIFIWAERIAPERNLFGASRLFGLLIYSFRFCLLFVSCLNKYGRGISRSGD